MKVPKRFNIVSSICSSSKVRQVELDLIPTFIESHWHSTNEWLDSSGALVVRSSESSSYVLII